MQKELKMITISGGKGGVGKTVVSINLAVSLSKRGFKVLLFDADFGLSNIGVCLNVKSKNNLSHLISEEADLDSILVEGPQGIKIIPSVSGNRKIMNLNVEQYFGILNEIQKKSKEFDFLIIDTPAGIPEKIFSCSDLYQDIFLVASHEPASIADCYAIIKYLNVNHNMKKINLISNMGKDEKESLLIYNKISKIADMFLDVDLKYSGYVLFDENVRNSLMGRVSLVERYPNSKASQCFMKIANSIKI